MGTCVSLKIQVLKELDRMKALEKNEDALERIKNTYNEISFHNTKQKISFVPNTFNNNIS